MGEELGPRGVGGPYAPSGKVIGKMHITKYQTTFVNKNCTKLNLSNYFNNKTLHCNKHVHCAATTLTHHCVIHKMRYCHLMAV